MRLKIPYLQHTHKAAVGLYEYAKSLGVCTTEAANKLEADGYQYVSDNPSTGEIEYLRPEDYEKR